MLLSPKLEAANAGDGREQEKSLIAEKAVGAGGSGGGRSVGSGGRQPSIGASSIFGNDQGLKLLGREHSHLSNTRSTALHLYSFARRAWLHQTASRFCVVQAIRID